MNTSNTEKKAVLNKPSDAKLAEVETIYTGQKPQFQQSANKPQKTLRDHPKHSV